MLVLIINPGSTTTKVAVYDEATQKDKRTIAHEEDVLRQFNHIIDQLEYRKGLVLDAIREMGYKLDDFSAICSRGGLLRHIPSGIYAVNDKVIFDIEHPLYGEHAANLGILLAKELGDMAGIPAFFMDPPSTDEMTDVARISGYKGMDRESFFHALNQKGMARRAAQQLGRAYEEVNLVVVHTGGGVSVAAHEKGRVIDVYNVKDEGSFSMDRGGSLPVNALINLCFSGKTRAEIKKELGMFAGVYSYLGTRDFREVEERAVSGEAEAKLIFDALVYQHCKDIGAMASVLRFQVDAIVLTGGIAYSRAFCVSIIERVGKIAPVMVLPGEVEMQSLAQGAMRVLHGEKALEY